MNDSRISLRLQTSRLGEEVGSAAHELAATDAGRHPHGYGHFFRS